VILRGNSDTIIAGTLSYLAPEGFSNTTREACKAPRDIWSFGVLLCELLQPKFMDSLALGYISELRSCCAMNTKIFARKVAEEAQKISGDPALVDMAISCLFFDPALRPRAEEIVARMEFDAPLDPFRFEDYYTSDFRAKEIIGFARNYFDDNAHIITLQDSIQAIEDAARDNADISARSVLGYCYYFGIGVEQNVVIACQMFKEGCDAKNDMAMYAVPGPRSG